MTILPRLLLAFNLMSAPWGTSGSAQSAELLTASVIAPIVTPIAKEILSTLTQEAKKGAVALSSKKTQCKLCNFGLKCKEKHLFSVCKSRCTAFHQIGGYELRIRFGEEWSLTECVTKGVRAQLQSPQGKGNTKSIAIYSQKDLDHLLELIAIKMAAHSIVDTGGKNISPKDLTNQGITRTQAVDEAQETIDTIAKSIDEAVRSGRFGNQ